MAKSLIYIVNPNAQTLAVNDIVNLGSTVRRFGCNIRHNGSIIFLNGAGYYKISAVFTFAPTAAGTATVTLLDNGSAVTGASASATTGAATESQNLVIETVVRVKCGYADDALSFILTGAAGVMSNVSVTVEKV